MRIDKRLLAARNLEITTEDLVLQLSEGTVFRVRMRRRVTGLILMGRGVMTFSPTAAVNGQLRLFRAMTLQLASNPRLFINPSTSQRVSISSLDLRVRPMPSGQTGREAPSDHARNVQRRSAGSQARRLVCASIGDFLAEVDTTLRYADLHLTAEQAEDISVFVERPAHAGALRNGR